MEEKIYFKNTNGLKLCGILTKPQNETHKCVILCHGITVTKDEGGVFTELAKKLTDNDFMVFRFDFRGHGESEGNSIDLTISGEEHDLEAAIAEVRTRECEEIGLLGASFGGGTSAIYASKNQQAIKCLCLWNPVLNYEHTFLNPTLPWIKERKTHMAKDIREKGWTTLGSRGFVIGKTLFEEMGRLQPFEALKDIKIPTMLIHGTNDTKVPYEDSKEYTAFLIDGKLITINGAEHGFHDEKEMNGAINKTVEFFISYL